MAVQVFMEAYDIIVISKGTKMIIPVSLIRWFERGMPEGGRLYLVGGTVRDLLMNSEPKDLDLVCKDAKKLAAGVARQKHAALVMMEKKADDPCYRVVDRDNPDEFLDIAEMRGDTIQDDLSHRDFTINALAIKLRDDGSAGELLDPFYGRKDIQQKIVRMVSKEAFVSDPLRILRAFRFAAALGFAVDGPTLKALQSNSALLKQVSVERIMAELKCILLTSNSSAWFRQMDDLGILEIIFPEILPMKGCEQNWYHHKDVWEHSLLVMEQVERILSDLFLFGEASAAIAELLDEEKTVFLKLAGLLHDIGKPATKGIKPETRRIIFYGHDKAGAEIIKEMAVRLKLSCRSKDLLVRIVSEHLRPLALSLPKATHSARMRWFRRMRDDSVPALILAMADVMSSQGPESGEDYREHFMVWAAESIQEYFNSIKPVLESPLLINGDDLISMGVEPGIALGNLLYRLRFAQDLGKITSRQEALEAAKEMVEKFRQ
ncbi:MAG: HD domain-containing protein [Nitrospirota bacterium]|nr:HD domain-containing protein [Nitrospirota bacterium]